MKAIFTYDYGNEKMDSIRKLGYDIEIIHESEIENNKTVNDAEILVCYNPFDRIDVSQMNKLKWIQLSSIGFDQLPEEDVLGQGITVTNNQGGYSKPMGEWIVMNILEILKNRKAFYAKQEARVWKLDSGILELVDKKVAFLGTGTIAQEAAKRLQGFETHIVGFNTSGHEADHFDACYKIDDLETHLPELDVVVMTLPHTDKTHHFMNKARMDLMRDDSILINVSRGPNIDEEALIDALKHDKFLGAALDVYATEPLPMKSPLWAFDRVYLSPHNSWVSEMKNERRFKMIYKNMQNYIEGRPLMNRVNIARGY